MVGTAATTLAALRVEPIPAMSAAAAASASGAANTNDISYLLLVHHAAAVAGGLFRRWPLTDGIAIGCDLRLTPPNRWCRTVDGVPSSAWRYCCAYGAKVGQHLTWWGVRVISDCREGIPTCRSL